MRTSPKVNVEVTSADFEATDVWQQLNMKMDWASARCDGRAHCWLWQWVVQELLWAADLLCLSQSRNYGVLLHMVCLLLLLQQLGLESSRRVGISATHFLQTLKVPVSTCVPWYSGRGHLLHSMNVRSPNCELMMAREEQGSPPQLFQGQSTHKGERN